MMMLELRMMKEKKERLDLDHLVVGESVTSLSSWQVMEASNTGIMSMAFS